MPVKINPVKLLPGFEAAGGNVGVEDLCKMFDLRN